MAMSQKTGKKEKKNFLLEKIVNIFENEKKGRVLDLGCGEGGYACRLQELGFAVLAGDMDIDRFCYEGKIDFKKCNINQELPFENESFDYIVLAEVIEHVKDPYKTISELRRILKPNGKLVLSTPNILNLKSRIRFLIEGCWEYFREIPMEHSQNPKEVIWNLHLIPWRYHELEHLLYHNGLEVKGIFTSKLKGLGLFFLIPLIQFQLLLKLKRAESKGGIDYTRINKILLSKEMLFGEHLIVKAVKREELS